MIWSGLTGGSPLLLLLMLGCCARVAGRERQGFDEALKLLETNTRHRYISKVKKGLQHILKF